MSRRYHSCWRRKRKARLAKAGAERRRLEHSDHVHQGGPSVATSLQRDPKKRKKPRLKVSDPKSNFDVGRASMPAARGGARVHEHGSFLAEGETRAVLQKRKGGT